MLSSLAVAAAKYPSEPINNVCLFGPGDQADVFNRLLSRHFEKSLGIPVITVNKPGGGGAVGFSYLAGCKPDGYTIGVGTLENMIVPTLTEGKPPYSAEDRAEEAVGENRTGEGLLQGDGRVEIDPHPRLVSEPGRKTILWAND